MIPMDTLGNVLLGAIVVLGGILGYAIIASHKNRGQ